MPWKPRQNAARNWESDWRSGFAGWRAGSVSGRSSRAFHSTTGDILTREIAGAIVVLAGSLLVATGVIAEAMGARVPGTNGGCWFGGFVIFGGFVYLFGGTLRRIWDAIGTQTSERAREKERSPAESRILDR